MSGMNVNLLYSNKDWVNVEFYYDQRSLLQDLGLNTLCRAASQGVVMENGEVKELVKPDSYLQETMRKVMMVPLQKREEVIYRQDLVKDCIANEEFIRELYQISDNVLKQWDKLGRRASEKAGNRNSISGLVTEIHVFNLFVDGLAQVKNLLGRNSMRLKAKGFRDLYARLQGEYSDEIEENMRAVQKSISFFVNEGEEANTRKNSRRPKIVMQCEVGEGMKLQGLKLEQVDTELCKYVDPNSTISKVKNYVSALNPDTVSIQKQAALQEQTAALEYQIVKYIMNYCAPFLANFNTFFDQLHLQAAFYYGAVNIKHHMNRYAVEYCFPQVGAQDCLKYSDLKEFVMCMEQRVNAVGNTGSIQNKMLLIITGANQGGKSTFLRSVGIAQVMMQCGLPVAATYFESGLYPAFFTHFTRREDSEMNSGRLDEELGRMNQIIEHLGEHSLVLLNESFATTTEKEGSVIAYDIIQALIEAGVKILTVTHLLSFAQKIYGQIEEKQQKGGETKVEFFSAQRMEDGKRTFKMIQHAPELTSFGLDLYEDLIKPLGESVDI